MLVALFPTVSKLQKKCNSDDFAFYSPYQIRITKFHLWLAGLRTP